MDTRQTITQLYRDYETGNVANILATLPDDFVFESLLDPSLPRYAGICRTKDELVQHLTEIGENFQFNAYHATNILVDGDRAAAQVQVDLTSLITGRRFPTTIAHFWSFKDGIPVQLVEYMDTALVARHGAPSDSAATSP